MNVNISSKFNIKGIQIATIVFLIISVVLIWQITNLYPEINILQNSINNQEVAVKDSEDMLQRLKEFVGFVGKNKEITDKFNLILPAVEDKANLLSGLNSLASVNGLNVLKIAFEEDSNSQSGQQNAAGDAAKNSDFDSRTIKISMHGSYVSFKNFLAAIEKNLRIADVVSVVFSSDSSSKETEGEVKTYSYSVEIKTYLDKPRKEEDVAKLLSSGRFKNFTVKNLNFTKEKIFNDLVLPPGYNINVGSDEIGNQNIF